METKTAQNINVHFVPDHEEPKNHFVQNPDGKKHGNKTNTKYKCTLRAIS